MTPRMSARRLQLVGHVGEHCGLLLRILRAVVVAAVDHDARADARTLELGDGRARGLTLAP